MKRNLISLLEGNSMKAIEIIENLDEDEKGEIAVEELPTIFTQMNIKIEEKTFEILTMWLMIESNYNTR